MRLALALVALTAACGPETTSFRTTDKGDELAPSAAAYEVRLDRAAASVHVSSNGGYVSTGEEPMTHVAFEIRNVGHVPIDFDGNALSLRVFGRDGVALPPTTFAMVTPLGPAEVTIAPGTTVALDGYFVLPVRPRAVASMRVRWSLRAGDARFVEETSFVRDDDYPVLDTSVPRS